MRLRRLILPVPRLSRDGAERRAIAAPILLVAGIGAIVLLHLLSREVSPASHYISEYGNRTWGWLLSASLILIAAGLLALGAVIRGVSLRTRRALVGARLLQGSAAMLVVAAFFSTDRFEGEVEVATLAGRLHGLMSIGAFVMLVLAMALLSPRGSDEDAPLGSASAVALPLALAAPAIAAAAFALMPDADGLRQRVFLAIVFGWLLATAFELRSLIRDGDRARS